MKTQVFATFGPACRSKEILKEMIAAGMTGIRLNLSHTTLLTSQDDIRAYQEAAREMRVSPQILIDMQGPELRIGNLEKPILLEKGITVRLGVKGIPIPKEIFPVVCPEDKILLDDGKIQIKVVSVSEDFLLAEVIRGGMLRGHKSIKIENRNIKMPVLTDHDLENIRLAKAYGVTALMQPFVRNGEDLAYVRAVLKENHAEDIQIFAKIENRLGVENLESILSEADVVVIARGDLGNDMPLWELPTVQKQIENVCKKHNRSYVVVTQMLASMEENPVPTRAEVSDIFHAVWQGAWGVMITGESAVGKYPVKAVEYLAKTAREAEKYRDKESENGKGNGI